MENQTQAAASSVAQTLRNLSIEDFQSFGMGQVAYVKPVTVENRNGYALYGADGKLLTLQDTPDLAMMVARHNGLEPVVVH